MGVRLHQTWQRNTPATIQDTHSGRRRTALNTSCRNQNIREVAPKRANVTDEQISCHRLCPIYRISECHSLLSPSAPCRSYCGRLCLIPAAVSDDFIGWKADL